MDSCDVIVENIMVRPDSGLQLNEISQRAWIQLNKKKFNRLLR